MFDANTPEQGLKKSPQLLGALQHFQSILLLQFEALLAYGCEWIGRQPLTRFGRYLIELQFEMLQGRIGAHRQGQERESLLAFLLPTGLVVNQVPEVSVIAALRQVQIARLQVIPHGEPQCDLPGVLP